MNKYITDFSQIASSTATYKKQGNGAFFHSCHTHCEACLPPVLLTLYIPFYTTFTGVLSLLCQLGRKHTFKNTI